MKDSAIEWTDHTFNPWIGCTKVSPGCLHCYAETLMDKRYRRVKWGKGNPRQRTSPDNWKQPLKWNRSAGSRLGFVMDADCFLQRPRVFCASLADWLDEEVPIEWLTDLLKLIYDTPNLDWLLLTKRPQNWAERLMLADEFAASPCDRFPVAFTEWLWHWRYDGCAPDNVWIGFTAEDQERWDARFVEAARIPALIRFASCEPLLGRVHLGLETFCVDQGEIHLRCEYQRRENLPRPVDWVICGGESGPGARPMKTEWAESLQAQCKDAEVAFFMKQLGGSSDARGNIDDFPESLRVRQFPTTQSATPDSIELATI